MKTKKLTIALLIIAITIAGGNIYAQQFASIGKGILHILGADSIDDIRNG